MEDTIGSRIRTARKRAGMTQTAFAGKLGVTQSAVAKYEKDGDNIAAAVMEKIAEITGTPLSVLYGSTVIPSDDLLAINEKYNSLNEIGKKRLHEYLDELIQLYPK